MKKRILIAEDNDSNYLLLSKILGGIYDIERACNGVKAIELYTEINPDLILMDIKMPEMDGLEATSEIRKMDNEIPIIALTANAFDEDKQKAYRVGCSHYMTKPINIKLLKDTIAKFI